MKILRIVLLSFLIYFSSWLLVSKTGVNKLTIQSEDTIPALFIPVTLIKEGTLYVDSYYKMLLEKYPHPDDKDYQKGLTPFYLRKVIPEATLSSNVPQQVHYISAFPIISGLLAVPVFYLPLQLGMPVTWENLALLGHITGSLIMALSGGFFFILVKKHFELDTKKSYLITFIYLFGTINYALISQALWQHGTLQLFLIIGLIFLFNGLSEETSDKPNQFFWSAFFLCLAVLSRPTAALSLGFLSILIYFANKDNFRNLIVRGFYFVLGLIPVIGFFVWYNATYYLSLSNQGYSNQVGTSWLGKFPEGFLGVWFSPSKGILVYSPVFIFAFIGLYLALKKGWKSNFQYLIFALIILIHTLVIGKWKHWYGGWSFGYRMSADIIPFLVLLLVPYLKSDLFERTKKIFYALVGLSFLVQIYGMLFFDGIWHSAYDGGFTNTSWLWSIKDSEFLFNIRRILVKLGLMEQACPRCLPG